MTASSSRSARTRRSGRSPPAGHGLVDLAGHTVLPGFYDNHIHIGGAIQRWHEGFIPAVSEWTSDADTVDKLMTAHDKVPNRWELDEVTPEHPVVGRRRHPSFQALTRRRT